MSSMTDSKWREQKEENIESKTKSCQEKRKSYEVGKTFQQSAWKPSWNQTLIHKVINGQLVIKLEKITVEELEHSYKPLPENCRLW